MGLNDLTREQNKRGFYASLIACALLGGSALLMRCYGCGKKKEPLPINGTKAPLPVSNGKRVKDGTQSQLIPGHLIPDEQTMSPLMGHSEAIVVLNGEPGSGKTPLAIGMGCEACEGIDYGIFTNPTFTYVDECSCIYYHTEYDSKFNSHYGEKLNQLENRFQVRYKCRYDSIQSFIETLSTDVNSVGGNCCIVIDTPSTLFPKRIKGDAVQEFMDGLKLVREKRNSKGFHITFIIVTHKSEWTKSARGSSVWYEDAETFIDVTLDPKDITKRTTIVEITKRKSGPTEIVRLKRVIKPYMHFERIPASQGVSTPAQNKPSVPCAPSVSAAPVDKDTDLLFHSLYEDGVVSYADIYSQYKDQYQLKSRDSVRNAIQRVDNEIIKSLPDDVIFDIACKCELTDQDETVVLKEVRYKYNIRTLEGLRKIKAKGIKMVE